MVFPAVPTSGHRHSLRGHPPQHQHLAWGCCGTGAGNRCRDASAGHPFWGQDCHPSAGTRFGDCHHGTRLGAVAPAPRHAFSGRRRPAWAPQLLSVTASAFGTVSRASDQPRGRPPALGTTEPPVPGSDHRMFFWDDLRTDRVFLPENFSNTPVAPPGSPPKPRGTLYLPQSQL